MATKYDALRVLIVDDNVDVVDTLSVALALDGVHVRTAYDGESALRALLEEVPDAVILDLLLPDIDGYQIAQAVRSDPRYHNTHLIAHTGDSSQAARERCAAAGFDLYIVKPIDPSELLNAIVALQRATAGDERRFRWLRAIE